jgi:hypothetical protein
MADSQEMIMRSPYPDLILEMAAVRMASLAAVIDADELLRAIGAGGSTPPSSGKPPTDGGGVRGASSETSSAAGAKRLRVEGEVKADAPLRASAQDQSNDAVRELPELRDFIRGRRAALAGFMEQGAGLVLDKDTLTVSARNDIYIRYLSDNRAVIAELASEHLGRPIRVELSGNGGTIPRAKIETAPQSSNGAVRDSAPTPIAKPASVSAARIVERPAQSATPANPAARRAATPEERTAVLTDPAVRRVFDTLDARLVELRMPNRVDNSDPESK